MGRVLVSTELVPPSFSHMLWKGGLRNSRNEDEGIMETFPTHTLSGSFVPFPGQSPVLFYVMGSWGGRRPERGGG